IENISNHGFDNESIETIKQIQATLFAEFFGSDLNNLVATLDAIKSHLEIRTLSIQLGINNDNHAPPSNEVVNLAQHVQMSQPYQQSHQQVQPMQQQTQFNQGTSYLDSMFP
ncbi:MAG: hypothetical protein ACRCXZ_04240, partial [Patescibacteria group bacterium]